LLLAKKKETATAGRRLINRVRQSYLQGQLPFQVAVLLISKVLQSYCTLAPRPVGGFGPEPEEPDPDP
jgi:hypothetical protein